MEEAKWYVIRTYSGQEAKAKRNLEKVILDRGLGELIRRVVMPMEETYEYRKGKKTPVQRKFFSSYILVECVLNRETQSVITETPGITNFVMTGGKPHPLSADEVKRLLAQIEGGKAREVTEIPYRVGDSIRVMDGPFKDFTGVINEINKERGKVKVMVSIFGRLTPIELDFMQVKDEPHK